MRRIVGFKVFESLQSLTEEQKEFIDNFTKGKWSLREDGKVDVDGDFNCSYFGLVDFKGIEFGVISGDFLCSYNQLTSLEGAPQSVGGVFYCYTNKLSSLEGAPQTIGGEFDSDSIKIPKGKWGLQEFLRIFMEGNKKQRSLIDPLISPEGINKMLRKDPEKTMISLKGIWNSEEFKGIRTQLEIPDDLKDEMDLLGDLDGIGL